MGCTGSLRILHLSLGKQRSVAWGVGRGAARWVLLPTVPCSEPGTCPWQTYSVDRIVPDSASTSTAYLCGVKGNYHTAGVSAAARLSQCNTTAGNEVVSVLERARKAGNGVQSWEGSHWGRGVSHQGLPRHEHPRAWWWGIPCQPSWGLMCVGAAGKAVGIVTTSRVQHASPSGAYAHVVDRNWYADVSIPEEARLQGCKDIAWQLVHNVDINVSACAWEGRSRGRSPLALPLTLHPFLPLQVIMGGGRIYMTPAGTPDPEYPTYETENGIREDGENLINKWLEARPVGEAAGTVLCPSSPGMGFSTH